MIGKTPPNSPEAERAVVGAILLNNEVLVHISLTAEDFYGYGNQRIFEHMMALDGSGIPVDTITVMESLRDGGELERVGGGAYLAGLTNQVSSTAHAIHFAKEIKRLSSLRKMSLACMEIIGEIDSPLADLDAINNRFLDMLDGDSIGMKGYSSKEVMAKTAETIQAIMSGTCPDPLSSGLVDLDDMVQIEPGDFVVIAGRPGMGKTSIALAISRRVAESEPVGIFTLEMDYGEIGQVFLAQETGISRQHIRKRGRITDEGYGAMERTFDKHANRLKYRVFDDGYMTPADIRKSAKLMKKREGLGLIVVDYLSLMDAGIKTAAREEAVAHISRSFKRLAKELQVPVIGLQQLNRQCEQRVDKKPNMADLRESGSIEQDADIVLLAYRPEKYWPADEDGLTIAEMDKRAKWTNIVQILVEKQRAGSTGVVKLAWDGPATNVKNLARSF